MGVRRNDRYLMTLTYYEIFTSLRNIFQLFVRITQSEINTFLRNIKNIYKHVNTYKNFFLRRGSERAE